MAFPRSSQGKCLHRTCLFLLCRLGEPRLQGHAMPDRMHEKAVKSWGTRGPSALEALGEGAEPLGSPRTPRMGLGAFSASEARRT